jgi:hypothetical protein
MRQLSLFTRQDPTQTILSCLQQGETIDSIKAKQYGVTNLLSIIQILQCRGLTIYRHTIRNRGAVMQEYSLVKTNKFK